MLRRAAVLVALVSLVAADWEAYKRKYNKSYTPEEDGFRRQLYEDAVLRVDAHNAEFASNRTSYCMGINAFADMTRDELASLYMAPIKLPEHELTAKPVNAATLLQDPPDAVDWTQAGYVTEVKMQRSPTGNCVSTCWTFAATGALEGQYYRATGQLVSLSEQYIVECSGVGTCNDGGLPEKALEFVQAEGRIPTEQAYPYTAKKVNCAYQAGMEGITVDIAEVVRLTSVSELQLMSLVATVGPVAVTMWSTPGFEQYNGTGVFNDSECHGNINHALLIVGYDTEYYGKTYIDYWLVKNSWGTSWGSQGYGKIARNMNSNCNIVDNPVYPQLRNANN